MKRLWNWLLMWGEWWPEDHKEGGRDSSEDEDAGGKREAERERERVRGGGVWLTIYIPFRGYHGTWLNPVRLNPLGERCCWRPSRNPLTGTRALLFTGTHLYSCRPELLKERSERVMKRERKKGKRSGTDLVQPFICHVWADTAHFTCVQLISFACDFPVGQYVYKLNSNWPHATSPTT